MGFARESNGFGGKSTLFASWTGPLIRRVWISRSTIRVRLPVFGSGFTPTTRVVEDKSKVS